MFSILSVWVFLLVVVGVVLVMLGVGVVVIVKVVVAVNTTVVVDTLISSCGICLIAGNMSQDSSSLNTISLCLWV